MQVQSEPRTMLSRISKENADLQLEVQRLRTQISTIYTQSAGLAAEADRSRKEVIAKMFPPVTSNFQPKIIHMTDVQAVLNVVPTELLKSRAHLYFLPRPPNCLPLRIHSYGHPGYWFDPLVSMNDEEFELIVEGRLGEWSYLGRYTTAKLVGHVMNVSEWMNLDEQTKLMHSARIASSASATPITSLRASSPTPPASIPAQMEVKRKFDTGEWTVPCYSLRCVGFDVPLYEAIYAAAETALHEKGGRGEAESVRSGMSSTPVPGELSERSVSPSETMTEMGSSASVSASRAGKRRRSPEKNGTGGERAAKKVYRMDSESAVS